MPLPDGLVAGKVVAVHLNYRSRAEQRGRVPGEPSYFLKPPSSLSGGGTGRAPAGRRAVGVRGRDRADHRRAYTRRDPRAGAAAIGWYAPANDFGVHDFRWADRGSNLLAKGQDGYTPIGPAVAAADVDAAALRLRTRVNGEVVQEAGTDELHLLLRRSWSPTCRVS